MTEKTTTKPFAARRLEYDQIVDDRAWLIALGESMFGARWKREFARVTGISPSYLTDMTKEEDPVPVSPMVRSKVLAMVEAVMPDMMSDSQWRMGLMARTLSRWR